MTRPDPVLLAIQAAVLVLAVVAVALIAARLTAAPQPACPAPDHPVQAQVLVHGHYRTEWICGDSLNIGVKSR